MTLRPVDQVILRRDGVSYDVSDPWVDRAGYHPPAGDLGGLIATATVVLIDNDGTIPIQAREGDEIYMYDPAAQLVFGGWIAQPEIEVGGPGTKKWTIAAQDWSARAAESSTGSLNKSGVTDSDRNFLIAMFLDALGASGQIFGADTTGTDDPIIAANVAAGWPLVQATAVLAGTDWSYRQLLDVIGDLKRRIPGVAIRIRPDKLVEYGILVTDAPFALVGTLAIPSMVASSYAEIEAGSYHEKVLTTGHYNRVRLGGFAAAEEIATDESSYARYGRVRNRPYENDENIPAGDLRRAAYAKLDSLAPRLIAEAVITDDGLDPGMRVWVIVPDLGTPDDIGWYPDTAFSFYLGTPFAEPSQGWRGEFLVQKVEPTFVSPSSGATPGVQRYKVELGAYRPEFERALAASIGSRS